MEWNPRYVAFAKGQGNTPEQQREHDREVFPGGSMTGFTLWISEMKEVFRKAHPEAMLDRHTIGDLIAWDAFLGVTCN